MGILDRFKKAKDAGIDRSGLKEPRCSVCGMTHSKRVAMARNAGLAHVGKGVGVCPTCRKAFCVDHMIRADRHDFMDRDKCPDDRSDLDLDWDRPPTPDTPWRLGPKPTTDPVKLIQRLNDPNYEVRRDAAKALGELGDPRALEPLIQALDAPPGLEGTAALLVRYAAAEALGDIKDTRAVDPLVRALDDPNDVVRRESAKALGKLKDPRAFEPLLRALRTEDYQTVGGAAEGLGDFGDPRAVEPLVELLAPGRGLVVQGPALEALRKLKGARAIEALSAALRDENLSRYAATALRGIGGPEAERALEDYRRSKE
jgi:hypothetical protein